jgi:thiosulfate/3-mercaptopyruvate sulfurtransferase
MKAVLLASAVAALAVFPAGAQRSPADAPLVVTNEWLTQHLRDPNLVLLHIGEKAGYDAEHIPGARFAEQGMVAVEGPDKLPLEMPPAEELRKRLEALGLSDDSRVVVYYATDWVSPATRVLFTLDHYGLGNRVSLLDGGMVKWKKAGGAVTAEVPPAKTGKLAARQSKRTIVDAGFVKSHIRTPGFVIIDARGAVYYDGPSHGDHRPGHVPGAVNIPFNTVFDDANQLKSPQELAAIFKAAGIKQGDQLIAYCHIGQQATAVVFAARSLGYDIRLYDGSFDDWSRRKELPTEGREAK